MTPNDLIKLALKDAGVIGVGQTPLAEDVNDAFSRLNMMLAGWTRKRWLVFHLVDASIQGTGATSYTIGPGGDIDMPRPVAVDAAYVRQLTQAVPYQVDTPLGIVRSYEDWSSVALKQQPGFPQFVFLDTGAPLARLYVWPLPSSLYAVHLVLRAPLSAFSGLTQSITLPDEYQEAILYNLTARLLASYRLPPDPTVTALARASLNTLRNANAQIPLLGMPPELARGGTFNVYTGRYR